MNTSLLDVLHDGTDDAGLTIGDAIDINLSRVLKEAVNKDGAIGSYIGGVIDVSSQLIVIISLEFLCLSPIIMEGRHKNFEDLMLSN